MTPFELREKGYQVLFDNLGQVATIRFLQEMGWGAGNYTQERQQVLNSVTRTEFWADMTKLRQDK
jgi:hypothetical protein